MGRRPASFLPLTCSRQAFTQPRPQSSFAKITGDLPVPSPGRFLIRSDPHQHLTRSFTSSSLKRCLLLASEVPLVLLPAPLPLLLSLLC